MPIRTAPRFWSWGCQRFDELLYGCRDIAISMCLGPTMFLRHRESVLETEQKSSGEDVSAADICPVSTADICPVSAADICPVSTADICPVSTEDIYPVSTADILGGYENDFDSFFTPKMFKLEFSRRCPAEPDGMVAETLKRNLTNHA